MLAFKNERWITFLPWAGFFVFISAYIAFLLPFTAGPLTWDELWYLDLSLNTRAEPAVLFRYGHVYLQKLFLFLVPGNAILASRIYWLFLTGTTLWLIAVVTYKLSGKKFFAILVACYFFGIQKLVYQKYTGVTYADFTVMFLGACMLAIYYSQMREGNKLFLLVFLFAYAIKCKETALPLMLLPLAQFLQHRESSTRWKTMILSVVSSIAVFILLDALCLKEAAFSFSPSSLNRRSEFDLFKAVDRSNEGWAQYLISSTLVFPLILYGHNLLSAERRSFHDILVQLVVPGCVAFLAITMIFGNWGVEDRYILPAIPFLCVFAPAGLFSAREPENESLIRDAVVVLVTVLACYGIEKWTNGQFVKYGWNASNLHTSVFLPLCVTLFFVILAFRSFLPARTLRYALYFPVLLYTLPDLKGNIIVLKKKDAVNMHEKRFSPFADFVEDLKHTEGKSVGVSANFFNQYGELARDRRSLVWMYEIYFNTVKSEQDLKLIQPEKNLPDFDILLLTDSDSKTVTDSTFLAQHSSKQKAHSVLLIKKQNAIHQ